MAAAAVRRKASPLGDAGQFTDRGALKFRLRVGDPVVKTTNFAYDKEVVPRKRGGLGRGGCCSGGGGVAGYGARGSRAAQAADVPDVDFCADSQVKLSNGITAYRLTEPPAASAEGANIDEIPLVVCLHDMTNSSYMWADAVDLLADCEQGPNARVLVLDFYGRGRSPWIGVPCSLEVFVFQVKELLDCMSSHCYSSLTQWRCLQIRRANDPPSPPSSPLPSPKI